MKRKQTIALLLAACLGVSGCGLTPNASDDSEAFAVSEESAAEQTEENGESEETEAPTESEETEALAALEESAAEQAEETQTEENAEAAEPEILITAERIEGSSDPKDPTVSYTYSYDLPTVIIEGNKEAQEAIQADLRAYVEQFLTELEEDDFGNVESGMPPMECYQDLGMKVLRADEKVISIQMGNEGYAGGAHGWYMLTYFNYFTQTGQRITFEALGDGFREKAEELVAQEAAAQQAEQERFFSDYEKSIPLVVLDGTENRAEVYQRVYGDLIQSVSEQPMAPTFYLTQDGFGFVSGQYVLQPYAGGIAEFQIPAAAFGDACGMDLWKS